MNQKQEFALSIIRAPWATRLTDRSFLLAVAAVGIGLWLFRQNAITGSDLALLITGTWGVWIGGNTLKDSTAINGALKNDVPQSVAVGTLGTTTEAQSHGDAEDNDGYGPQDDEDDQ